MKRTAWKIGLALILVGVLTVGLAPGVWAEPGDVVDPVTDLTTDAVIAEAPETEVPVQTLEEPIVPEIPEEEIPVAPLAITLITGFDTTYDASPATATKTPGAAAFTGLAASYPIAADMFLGDLAPITDADLAELALDLSVTDVSGPMASGVTVARVTGQLAYTVTVPTTLASGVYITTISLTSTAATETAVPAFTAGQSLPILTLTITVQQETYVSGFAAAPSTYTLTPSATSITNSTTTYDLTLPANMFTLLPASPVGVGNTVTVAKLNQAFELTTSIADFTSAVFVDDGTGKIVIRVTKSNTATPGAKNVVINAYYKPSTIPNPSATREFIGSFPPHTITIQDPVTASKIIGINTNASASTVDTDADAAEVSRSGNTIEIDDIEILSGDRMIIRLDPDFFTWQGTIPNTSAVSYNDLYTIGGFRVTSDLKSNDAAIDDYGIEQGANSEAYLYVDFENYSGNGRTAQTFSNKKITLSSSNPSASVIFNLSGEIDEELFYVTDDREEVDLSDGTVAVSEERSSLRDVEFDLGEGVRLVTDLARNRRVSGSAELGPISNADDRMMDRYWEIDEVVTLTTYGLSGGDARIYFDDWDNDHVYRPSSSGSSTLVYLGTANRGVEYSTKYYISSERIEGVSSASSSSGSSSSSSGSSLPQIGGSTASPSGATPGGSYPQNPNYNPINGR